MNWVQGRAFGGNEASAARWFAARPTWWDEHFRSATDQLREFVESEGLAVSGARVLDLGCGDGIISLGILRRCGAASVMAIDLVDHDATFLDEMARQHGERPVAADEAVTFLRAEPYVLPFDDDAFDLVTAWSVFEHVEDPGRLLREVHRVLRPGGALFLQVWPLYSSEHGGHLWPWFDSTFQHLVRSPEEIREHLQERIDEPSLAAAMFDLFQSCNGATVDDLQLAIVDAGLFIARVALETNTFHVPVDLQRYPISKLGISGLKLLAVRTG